MTHPTTQAIQQADLETQAWNCDKWPKWLDDLVEETNMVADRTDMSSEQAHAYAILRALSAAASEREQLEARVKALEYALKFVANSGDFACFKDGSWDVVNTALDPSTPLLAAMEIKP